MKFNRVGEERPLKLEYKKEAVEAKYSGSDVDTSLSRGSRILFNLKNAGSKDVFGWLGKSDNFQHYSFDYPSNQ